MTEEANEAIRAKKTPKAKERKEPVTLTFTTQRNQITQNKEREKTKMADELIYDDSYLASLENDNTEMGAEFDPDADYAAAPPPLPDGWHQAKLRNIGAKDKKSGDGVLRPFVGPRSWGNIPATFFTQIEASIVDPGGPQDGKKTNRFNVTTHPEERRNNASSANLVYRAIKDAPLPGLKQANHMALIIEELKGQEPMVWVKTQLEGESPEASKAYQEKKDAGTLQPGDKKAKMFRGQKAFTDANGKLTGILVDPETGERVVGRPSIVDIKPASFVPPTKGGK